MERLPALLATLSGGVALAFALVAWSLSRNPRWGHLRLFGWIAFSGALYAFGDAVTWLPLVPNWLVMWWAGPLNFALAAASPALWLHYSQRQYGLPVKRGPRTLSAIFLVVGGSSFVPGLVWTGELRVSHATSFGLEQRMPIPTVLGEALLGVIILGFMVVFTRYALLARARRRGAVGQAVAFGLLLLLSIHEVCIVLGLISTPTLTAFGFGLLVLPFSAELSMRYAVEAQSLADESERLNEEVRRRTAELVEARDRLLRAERLTALGTLAASVGHEINNPLAAVLMNVEWVREMLAETENDPELDVALSEGIDAARRIQRIVADLRVFARGDDGPHAEVSVPSVIERSLRLVANELQHRAAVNVEIEESLPALAVDETHLAQVLVNLLVNAGQAIPEERAGAADAVIVVRASRHGEWVHVDVEDTGSGMTEAEQRRLFEPFFTTKPHGKGTGLGLYVTHGIVKSFAGEIVVKSELGRGTCVSVRIPVRKGTSVLTPASEKVLAASIQDVRVLVVDDDADLARSLCRMLSDARVASELTATRALDRIANEPYDVVLCDLMLPTMTGMELYDEACRRDASLSSRFIFMTGGPLTERARSFVRDHHDHVLSKPFSRTQLEQRIRKICGLANPRSA